jgi:glutamyl-tRNA reductase
MPSGSPGTTMSAAGSNLTRSAGVIAIGADQRRDPRVRGLRLADLVSVGVDHATAALELRERLALAEADVPAALARLTDPAVSPLEQAVILSTCNRVEVYAAARTHPSREELVSLLARSQGLSPRELMGAVRVHRGDEVPYRLAETAAGLHSLVLGEAQIQGQVRKAVELAVAAGTAGPELRRMFESAIAAGRRVRSTTDIGRGVASVPHAAIQFARQRLGTFASATVLLVGAGSVSELAAKHLVKLNPATLLIIGRDRARAESLAERHGARALGSDALVEALAQARVVISSTGAPQPVLQRDQLERALAHRQGDNPEPLLLVDLAVPRDVDPAAAGMPGVELCTIDDLEEVVERTRTQRQAELPAAHSVLRTEVARFTRWLHTRAALSSCVRPVTQC